MSSHSNWADEQARVTIHADVERDDQILARLTARQLAILIPAAAAVWLAYLAVGTLLPAPIIAVLAAVILGTAAALALVERDGVGLDRLLVHALAQAVRPRRLVPAPEGVLPLPGWAASTDKPSERPVVAPAPLTLPVRAIRPDGVLDLGGDGVAVLIECSTVSFALRTAAEQAGLVSAFAAWLNSLAGPVQILVHAQPVNLHPLIGALRERAAALPSAALEDAARDHAAFLTGLAETRELLARQVLVVLAESYVPVGTTGMGAAGGRARRDVDGAASRVLRRADQTTRALAAAGVNARVLEAGDAAAVLTQVADPTAPPVPAGAAVPGRTITADPAGKQRNRTDKSGTGR